MMLRERIPILTPEDVNDLPLDLLGRWVGFSVGMEEEKWKAIAQSAMGLSGTARPRRF